MKSQYSFDNSNLLSANLSAKAEAVDLTGDYKPLIDYLDTNGIKLAYCTDTIINERMARYNDLQKDLYG